MNFLVCFTYRELEVKKRKWGSKCMQNLLNSNYLVHSSILFLNAEDPSQQALTTLTHQA